MAGAGAELRIWSVLKFGTGLRVGGLASCVRARGFYKGRVNLDFCAWGKNKMLKVGFGG